MSRNWIMLAGAAALALGACSSGNGEAAEADTQDEVAGTEDAEAGSSGGGGLLGGPDSIEPGEWETTTSLEFVDVEGLPQGVTREMLQKMSPRARTERSCITPEQAKSPTAHLLAGREDGSCDVERMEFGGGNVDMAMSCTNPGGQGRGDIKLTGSFTSDSYEMNGDMKGAGPGGITMSMKMHTVGKRLGACPG